MSKQKDISFYNSALEFLYKSSGMFYYDYTQYLQFVSSVGKMKYFLKNYSSYFDIKDKIITINDLGKTYLSTVDNFNAANTDWLVSTRSTDSKRSEMKYSRSRVLAMMKANEVMCYPEEKPSLAYLLKCGILSSRFSGNEKLQIYQYFLEFTNSRYNDTLTNRQSLALLKKGIYYTSQELRLFTKFANDTNDRYRPSRFAGIFVSLDKLLVFYTAKRGDNTTIQVDEPAEKELLDTLKEYFNGIDFNIYKPAVIHAGKISKPDNAIEMEAKPSAVVVSDSPALAYTLAVARKRGVVNIENEDILQKFDTRKTGDLRKKGLLNATTPLAFDGLYVVPYTQYGFSQIGYLTTHSAASIIEEGNKLISIFAGSFYKINTNGYFPFVHKETGSIAVMIPVLEVKMLKKLSEQKGSYVIFARPMSMEAIAHALRKETFFINIDTLAVNENKTVELTDRDYVSIYNELGVPAGKTIIEDFFKKADLKIHGQYYRCIYKLFQASDNEYYQSIDTAQKLYNAVAYGTIKPEEVYNLIIANAPEVIGKDRVLTPIKQTATRKDYNSSIHFSVTSQMKDKVVHIAEHLNITTGEYLRSIIEPVINYDAKVIAQHKAKTDGSWNKTTCLSCGAVLQAGSNYCHKCGSKKIKII